MASTSMSLEKACVSLTLREEEEEVLIVGKEDVNETHDENKLVLVGKLATDKPFKFNVMRDTLATVWRHGKGMQVTEIAGNLFIFQFYHEVDLKRVLDDGPWAFEHCLLVLKKLEPRVSPFDVSLKEAKFWVQAHNLPTGFFTERVAQAMGNTLEKFIWADKKNFEGLWKSFLRIRVMLDITKPLRRKMKIMKEGCECFWVEFRYERLLGFCFLCGIVGHNERFCHLIFEVVNEGT